MTPNEADKFVAEQSLIERKWTDPLPKTAHELRQWINHHPDIGDSLALREGIAFLKDPPLTRYESFGYRILQCAAATTIEPPLQATLRLKSSRFNLYAGRP